MIPLKVIMRDEFAYRSTQGSLPYEDHPIQALFLDRTHEALRIGIISSQQLHPVLTLRRLV
jgi:hypothetical protein